MNVLTGLLPAATAVGAGGLLYGLTITALAAASVFARTPARRRDARATLTLLLRRSPADPASSTAAKIEA
ncbi:hypothetical protein Sru01_30180 [Sphaerisporangium rufum]|uniref:Uncharacterized protein n=1 Tax=Sphaerisporangium rufum TaxID=1381558 RepID=A0A919R1I3_9ACTN|nr:hypothetical protein [Sphaerisporangium rufum]GII78036.1 hypothetical protein Sru01_30180 [Sphaerisporangium rufum]